MEVRHGRKKPKITVFPSPKDPFYREYSPNKLICLKKMKVFVPPLSWNESYNLEKIGHRGSEIIRSVIIIEGIVEVIIQPYRLIVGIGKAFDWEKIDPAIIDALKFAFRKMPNKSDLEIVRLSFSQTEINTQSQSIDNEVGSPWFY